MDTDKNPKYVMVKNGWDRNFYRGDTEFAELISNKEQESLRSLRLCGAMFLVVISKKRKSVFIRAICVPSP